MAEQVAEVIRAKRFELVDSDGSVRATLALHEGGTPGLGLFDNDGHERATLSLDQEGAPRLTLWSKAGNVFGSLEFGTEWRLGLVLTDRNRQVVWSAVHEGGM
jgi:hypothetical protein